MHLSTLPKKIGLLLLALAVIATLGVMFFVCQPSPAGKFPSRFSDAERREILSLIRKDGHRRSFRALTRGQFATAWRLARNTPRQSVWSVGSQPGGDIWVHVGVEDKSQTDGYQLSARYILTQQKGHWQIAGSDL